LCVYSVYISAMATVDRDPNQLEFALTCQHCGNVAYSQGSDRAHIKSSKKCKKFCVRCGCCGDLFFERLLLADHLNQPGIARRPACSPSQYLATSHVVVTRTTTTATVTRSRQSATTTTASSHIPTARDLGPLDHSRYLAAVQLLRWLPCPLLPFHRRLIHSLWISINFGLTCRTSITQV